MTPRYSNSLMLAWQVAGLEAKRLQAAFLEPAHLLLGVCKCVDIDVPGSIAADTPGRDDLLEELLREFRRLREAFKGADFDAMRFRRHYRTVLPEGSAGLNPVTDQLHRNDAARDVFADAEKVAQLSDGVVYPIHLLYALLAEDDSLRDHAMSHVQADPKQLRKTLARTLFSSQQAESSRPKPEGTQWN